MSKSVKCINCGHIAENKDYPTFMYCPKCSYLMIKYDNPKTLQEAHERLENWRDPKDPKKPKRVFTIRDIEKSLEAKGHKNDSGVLSVGAHNNIETCTHKGVKNIRAIRFGYCVEYCAKCRKNLRVFRKAYITPLELTRFKIWIDNHKQVWIEETIPKIQLET